MEGIQVIFSIRIQEGYLFSSISFADTTPEFKNITLTTDGANSSLHRVSVAKNVTYVLINELRSVIQEAEAEAQAFVYVFSVAADVKVFDFTCIGYEYQNQFIDINQVFQENRKLTMLANLCVVAGTQRVDDIKARMKQKYDLSKLQNYFDTVTIVEPISRFISLYTLLLHSFGDSQPKVDEAILIIDPTVAQYRSPKNPKHYETVFTKLRNELSHTRQGVSLVETHAQIRSNIDRFERIVKTHILK